MLRIGVIGTGWITQEFLHGAMDSGLWELTAVYSRSFQRGMAFARQYGEPAVFSSLEEFAAFDGMDAVYIASPNAFHYQHCKALLLAGKHVLCEKPLCAQTAKARELYALARDKGLVLLEAIMYLHQPQRALFEQAVQEIGPVSFAKIDFCQRSSKLDAYLAGELPNIFNPALETGALMDLGVYCVYPALALFGQPDSFQMTALPLASGADGTGVLTLTYPDKLVTLTWSKTGQAGYGSDFQGPNGTVRVGSISKLEAIARWKPGGEWEELYGATEKYKLMGNEAVDFHRCITQPAEMAPRLARWQQLSMDVSQLMEQARLQAGIRFPSDSAE